MPGVKSVTMAPPKYDSDGVEEVSANVVFGSELTVTVTAEDVDDKKCEVPLKVAVSDSVPAVANDVVQVAVPAVPRGRSIQPVIAEVPLSMVTVPDGVPADEETVAVRVTESPG